MPRPYIPVGARSIISAMESAGFRQKRAADVTTSDRLYDNTRRDTAFAVPVVLIRQWKSGGVQVTVRHRSGQEISNTHDPDEMLWCVASEQEEEVSA